MQINNSFKWTSCPLCKSKSLVVVGEITYRKPVMFSTFNVSLEKPALLCNCKDCKSSFTQNIVPEKLAMDLYANGESDTKWPRPEKLNETKPLNIINRLNQYFKPGTKVIDIGCNTGVLLDYARDLRCEAWGVEPSKTSQELLRQKGHTFFDSVDAVSNKYDVVTAFDVVEHVYDLLSFLEKISNLLAENGVIIFLTGDANSLSAKLAKKNWWYISYPEHIIFPSIKLFENLKDFELVSVDKTYASNGYKKSIATGLSRLIGKLLFRGRYDGLSSLGPDHMLIVLRKKQAE